MTRSLGELEAVLGRSRSMVQGWGMAARSEAIVYRPGDVAGLREVLARAAEQGVAVGFRGGGMSYGDASLNGGGILVDLTGFAAIKSFDEATGVLVAEPGLTIEGLWRHCLPRGFWPPVVPGTMFPTLGGVLSMNIHGKNNWRHGTIGEHVLGFELLTVDGELRRCSREVEPELFHAAIGGFGMLGCFTEVELRLKRVHSGEVEVTAVSIPSLGHMVAWMEERRDDHDYMVGWIDCFPGGAQLGRGELHVARYLSEGEDADPSRTLRVAHQDLPSRILGILPKRHVWRLMKPFLNDFGMRLVNALKYRSGRRKQTRGRPYRQPHAAFNFLLDYVPDWKKAYLPGGLIQYQSFVPAGRAAEVHAHLIRLCHRANLVPYLGVYKRHRPDPFLLTHAVDGFSFAMDFKVTRDNRERLWDLCHRMDDVVLEAGGRFYLAKDATMMAETAHRVWPAEALAAFRALKQRLDPRGLLQTDLSRRLFPELAAGMTTAEVT